MNIEIKNGTRVPVVFGRAYDGLAAIDGSTVLFRGTKASMRGIKEGTVDGNPVRVVSVAQSDVVPSVLVVEFDEVKP